ncbi:hypothetical protein F4677DRAFT_411337 [Hypoxylon crocopeplum]|nr:hypothetical protein F4677DRAFT_411337 [Hypoxylon crocopeplum]
MAIQTELKLAQPTLSLANINARNEQYHQQQWLRLISTPSREVVQERENSQHSNQQPPLSLSSQDPSAAHAREVQWFACQLSKGTLRQYLDIIPVLLPLPRGSTRLDLLPQDVLNRICQYVPYENLLWLYQESKTLNQIIDPHLAPYETKISFVLRAERDFPQHYGEKPPSLGCYMCHRVLPPSVFAADQPLQALLQVTPSAQQSVVNLRRFCIPCGIRWGCHGAGDKLSTRTGGRFWLCDCLRVLGDKTPGCKDCRALCPLLTRGPDDEMVSRRSGHRVWRLMN